MAKNFTLHENALISIRYRAVCMDDNWRSGWFADIAAAREAATKHRTENETHIIRIITEQTMDTLFEN